MILNRKRESWRCLFIIVAYSENCEIPIEYAYNTNSMYSFICLNKSFIIEVLYAMTMHTMYLLVQCDVLATNMVKLCAYTNVFEQYRYTNIH